MKVVLLSETERKPDSTPPPPRTSQLLDPQSMRWVSYGVEYVGVLGLFTYGGYQADAYFDTSPWWMVGGLLFSLTGMTYMLFKEFVLKQK